MATIEPTQRSHLLPPPPGTLLGGVGVGAGAGGVAGGAGGRARAAAADEVSPAAANFDNAQ